MGPTEHLPPVSGVRLELLHSLGYDSLEHDSHVPFLSHLIGTRRVLAGWGARTALCDAGLFHSAYGTEYFEPPVRPDRSAVTAIIGAEAERIAWLWCNIERATLDAGSASVRLRADGAIEQLTPSELSDVATLWAADMVEQFARYAPYERDWASGLLTVLDHTPPAAQAAVRQAHAQVD